MIEKPDTLTQEVMDLFQKKFPKKIDREVWICKYAIALTEIHLIEGLIGRRQKQKEKCSSCGYSFAYLNDGLCNTCNDQALCNETEGDDK